MAEPSQAVVVELAGEIDLANVLEQELLVADAARRSRLIVLDLSRLHFIDSSGVAFFFRATRRLHDEGKRLALVAPEGSPARRILDLVGATEIVDVHESPGDALRELAEQPD